VKGAGTQQAQVTGDILQAAARCLGRDGYGGLSVHGVAAEAGLRPTVVRARFGSRDRLIEAVVAFLAVPVFDRLERELAGLDDPAEVVKRGFATLWAAVTTDRALVIAWFGVRVEAVTNPALRGAANLCTERLRTVAADWTDESPSQESSLSPASIEVLGVACVQGLILDYVERGETPQLRAAIADFQRWLEGVVRHRWQS
jgi:AcrR family transcriptional regulator